MMTADPRRMFGTELRRQRVEAGLSLTDLSRLVHYSRSHLSKVETGAKPASDDLARQCDAVLRSGGTLIELAPGDRAGVSVEPDSETDEVWVMTLDGEGNVTFATVGRRSVLAGGAAAIAAALAASSPVPRAQSRMPEVHAAEPTLMTYRMMFDQLRKLGQWASPGLLIPQIATQVHALRTLAPGLPSAQRDAAVVLAARFAEYGGWLAQESGDDSRALWWTDQAVDLASAGGDSDMMAYAFVRRGLLALYRHEALVTIDLARAAQSATTKPRILGLAAQREAQGHALAGDYDACLRAIDVARTQLSKASAETEPVIGSSHVADIGAMAAGWCLTDLGRPAAAAEILQAELRRVPAQAARTRARYGARLALALAASGEPEAAGAAVLPVLEVIGQLESATIRSDLRQLARTLNRWHRHPAIQDVRIQLTDCLNVGTGPR